VRGCSTGRGCGERWWCGGRGLGLLQPTTTYENGWGYGTGHGSNYENCLKCHVEVS